MEEKGKRAADTRARTQTRASDSTLGSPASRARGYWSDPEDQRRDLGRGRASRSRPCRRQDHGQGTRSDRGQVGQGKADIHARNIRIEGQVRGDLFGEQEVIIETSGDVEGNLIAPSVRLENGSRFKGSIDMERAKQPKPQATTPQPGTANPMPASPARPGENQPAKSPPPGPGQRNLGS